MAAYLQTKGVVAKAYHAGQEPKDRARTQAQFFGGSVRVVVATVAFGMGLDKPDIRAVINYSLPRSPEAYIQQAGRAGRDGQPARCVSFIDPQDFTRLRSLSFTDGVDRPTVLKLLEKVFLGKQKDAVAEGRQTVGALIVQKLERELDMRGEVIETVLSCLELWDDAEISRRCAATASEDGADGVEAFDELKVEEKPIGKPLRTPIQDVYTITGVGTVPVGRVETGVMKAGQKIIVMPSGALGEIKSIETHHQEMPSAEAGDNIGFNLRGIEKKDIKRGDVLGDPENPPKVAKEFKAQIIVIHHPTAIAPGYTPVMHAHTTQVAATVTEFLQKINPATGAVEEENPKFLKVGDAAIVKIRPVRPTCIETFNEFPEMGRFALRDMGATIAAGIVKEITEEYKP